MAGYPIKILGVGGKIASKSIAGLLLQVVVVSCVVSSLLGRKAWIQRGGGGGACISAPWARISVEAEEGGVF